MPKSLLSASDLSASEIMKIIDYGLMFKKLSAMSTKNFDYLRGKFFLLLFEKPSTRTRLSFESAIISLGGNFTTISMLETQISRGEPVKDFARSVSSYIDGIIARVKSHETLNQLRDYSKVPVINALSDREHPVQALTDFMTIKEVFGKVKGLNIAFIGDGTDNVLNSLMIVASALGANMYIASPTILWPDKTYTDVALKNYSISGGKLMITEDPIQAISEADIVYTDVWVSMGKEDEAAWRKEILRPYQVNKDILKKARKNPYIMHCLPAVRGEEITDEVIESEQSLVFRQAENRLHLQKGLLYYLFYEMRVE